jgi:hypothetical protein
MRKPLAQQSDVIIMGGAWNSADRNPNGLSERCLKKTDDKIVLSEIKSRIFEHLVFPSHWAEEGVYPPNDLSKKLAFEICKHIFEIHGRSPDRIAPTMEGGVFIAYDSPKGHDSPKGKITLYIEAYNDNTAVYLVNDNINKKILASKDITGFSSDNAIVDNAIEYIK